MATGGAGTNTLRVVLLGKTGTGKSSLGNSLTRDTEKQFKVACSFNSETTVCDWNVGRWGEINVQVIDTPGLVDTHTPQDCITEEVGNGVALAAPGLHVFIFVVRCDRRFTYEESKAFQTIQEMFPEIENFLIIVFLGLDVFHEHPAKEMKLQEVAKEIDNFGEDLTVVLEAADNRYIAMMNKVPGVTQEEVDDHIRDLIEMMTDLVRKNRNSYYTKPVLKEITDEVEKLTDDYSKRLHLTHSQADTKVKEDIVNEELESGFFATMDRMVEFIVEMIKDGDKKIKEACSIM